MDKKIGIAIIIISLLIAIVGIFIFINYKNENKNQNKDNLGIDSEKEYTGIEIDDKERYVVNKIVNQFFDIINKGAYYNGDGSEYDMSEVNLQVYNLLSKQYVTQKGVKIENVFDHVYEVNNNNMILPVNIFKTEKIGGTEYLYVGKLVNMENKEDKL